MKWRKLLSAALSAALVLPAIAIPAPTAHAADFEYTPLLVQNPGFEESDDLPMPGWNVTPAMPVDNLEVKVAKDRKFSGNNSVKIVDNNAKSALEVSSSLIPVEGGQAYRLSAQIYVESKSVRAYLRFKKDGKELSSVNFLANTLNSWKELNLEGTAPDQADTAEIAFYMGGSGVGTSAYVDDIKLQKKKTLSPLPLPYDAPVMIGDAVQFALSQAAAYGTGPDGLSEQYVTTHGTPVGFHVVDTATGKLKFSQSIKSSADTIWGVAQGSDGNMYFSTGGVLYRYLVQEKRIEELGDNPSNKQVFDLKASKDGKIYGSTYSATNMSRVFEYDIQSSKFRDLGVMKEGQQYARGIGVTDDALYVGIGTSAHLMRYDRRTEQITEITIPGVTGTTKTISEVDINNGKLFAYSGEDLYVIDEQTGNFIRTITFQSKLSPPSPHNPDLVYYKLKGDLYSYNIARDEITKIEGIPALPDDTAVKSHAWVTPASGKFAGKQVLAGMAAFGESFLYDPVAGEYEVHAADLPTSATSVNALEESGGYLFMGGYQRGMSIYDTKTGKFVYENKQFHQPEGIGFLNDRVYFGTYSGARMYRLDMTKPLDYKELESSGNPGLALDIEDYQDRPFAMTSGDNKLFIGTFPGYGQTGGAITILEEKQNPDGSFAGVNSETFRHVVPDQSIFGLAYLNGKVYGGTSLNGGLGTTPPVTNAELFVFDTATKKVTSRLTPQIPGLQGRTRLIGNLSIGPDGLLWGIMDNTKDPAGTEDAGYQAAIFAMKPDTLEMVKSKIVTESPYNTSKFRPYYLRWGQDGLLYTTIGRQLFAIDPADMRAQKVIDGTVNLMTLGQDGSIYYVVGTKLYKLPVKVASASVESESAVLAAGDKSALTVKLTYANGKDTSIEGAGNHFVSSNPDIATVEGGVVTAHQPGTAQIKAVVSLDGRIVEASPVTITVVENYFTQTEFNTDGTVSGNVYFLEPQAGRDVTVEAHSSDDKVLAAHSVQTATYSVYEDGKYQYGFNFRLNSDDRKIRLQVNQDSKLYSKSSWLDRSSDAGNGGGTGPGEGGGTGPGGGGGTGPGGGGGTDPGAGGGTNPGTGGGTNPGDSGGSSPGNGNGTGPGSGGGTDSGTMPDASKILKVNDNQGVTANDLKQALATPAPVTILAETGALVPAAGLQGAAANLLTIQTDKGTFELEPSKLPLKEWAGKLGVSIEELQLRFSLTEPAKAVSDEAARAAKENDIELQSPLYEYRLTLESKGARLDITDFAPLYMKRTLKLSRPAEVGSVAAMYNADKEEFRFVPGHVDGTEASFWRTGMSVYAIIKSDKTFADLNGHWAEKSVTDAARKLIVNGVFANTFAPEENVTRAEFAAMLSRALGLSTGTDPFHGFTDLAANAWYTGEISSAVRAGLVDGYENGTFRPEHPVTRAEAAAMAVRALSFTGKTVRLNPGEAEQLLHTFADVSEAGWARNELAAAVKAKLLEGRGEGRLQPAQTIKRAEAAVVLQRVLEGAGFTGSLR
ncbi:S-layer homology domain-containing protein [Paenibacillus lutrae]|uniref:SLH domain-containing protein n=1 Tax=Paenibacillus lutrae TaxID=2078573 RepID=A0A7X3K1R3_9BACL|nr:S-layer homology domain-containing protein [Paenibacillus lutrae]MVP02395.1 hypothetical protein [Paenibacillus lutrae]